MYLLVGSVNPIHSMTVSGSLEGKWLFVGHRYSHIDRALVVQAHRPQLGGIFMLEQCKSTSQ